MSIKSFLENKSGDLDKAMSSLSHTLLEAIAREAIRADAADCLTFQHSFLSFAKKVRETRDSSELYVISGGADKALQDYNQVVSKYFKAQSKELQMLATNAMRTVAEIHLNSSDATKNLKKLEEQLGLASDAQSLHECRIQIGMCLQGIREEALRQQEQNGQTIARLHSEINQRTTPTASRSVCGDDPVSGLPARHQAEEALAVLANSGNPDQFAVLFVVHRVQLVNTKYGYAVGDNIIRSFLRHLMQEFCAVDDLFRWSGPAFLAVTHRLDGLQALRSEVARITSHRMEENIAVGSRNALLGVTASALTVQLIQEKDTAGLTRKLDEFVKTNG